MAYKVVGYRVWLTDRMLLFRFPCVDGVPLQGKASFGFRIRIDRQTSFYVLNYCSTLKKSEKEEAWDLNPGSHSTLYQLFFESGASGMTHYLRLFAK